MGSADDESNHRGKPISAARSYNYLKIQIGSLRTIKPRGVGEKQLAGVAVYGLKIEQISSRASIRGHGIIWGALPCERFKDLPNRRFCCV
jgi:hypothetical protein